MSKSTIFSEKLLKWYSINFSNVIDFKAVRVQRMRFLFNIYRNRKLLITNQNGFYLN